MGISRDYRAARFFFGMIAAGRMGVVLRTPTRGAGGPRMVTLGRGRADAGGGPGGNGRPLGERQALGVWPIGGWGVGIEG